MKPNKGLPLEDVVKIAHENNMPIIIDACMLPPPKSALRLYTSMGVDLVCMSGGKIIAGPNNTGILAGRRDLIKLAHLQSYPFEGVGRPAKLCRETIVGRVTSLKLYLEADDSLLFDKWLRIANNIAEELNKIPGIMTDIDNYKDMNGSPQVPLCTVRVAEEIYGMSTRDLHLSLIGCDPSIVTIYEPYFLLEDYIGLFSISPQYLSEGEDDYLINKIQEFSSK
jgi:L-seryl-tRNA(Ser) seleniumtransferase